MQNSRREHQIYATSPEQLQVTLLLPIFEGDLSLSSQRRRRRALRSEHNTVVYGCKRVTPESDGTHGYKWKPGGAAPTEEIPLMENRNLAPSGP